MSLPLIFSVLPAVAILAQASPREIAQTAKEVTVRIENTRNPEQNGSGVIVAKNKREYSVLTASKLVGGDRRQYVIYTSDDNRHRVTNIEILPMQLAILRFSSPIDYEIAPLAQGEMVATGQRIYVSGFPFPTGQMQQEYRFTDGKITNRLGNREQGYDLLYEAPTGNGMLGSPIFNEQGRVIGIHTASNVKIGIMADGTARIRIITNGAITIQAFLDWQASRK
ncbi:MAG: serine protease [Pseudanabaenaceae cyanobacterium]